MLNVDIMIYLIGAILLTCITIGFVIWGLKTGQFEENEHVKHLPLTEDEDENDS